MLAGEAVEGGVREGPGEFTHPVGAEVEENHTVVVGDGAFPVADDGFQKLIGDAAFQRGLHRLQRADFPALPLFGVGLSVDHGVIDLLNPVPAPVPVHGVEAPGDGGDFPDAQFPAERQRLFEVSAGGGGGDIPAVEEGVDIDAPHTLLLRHTQEGRQVVDMGVDAAVGEEAREVEGGAVGLTVLHRAEKGGILKKTPIPDGAVNPGDILRDNPPGIEVGVSGFPVAGGAGGQAHILSGGGEGGVGVFQQKLVQPGRLGDTHGVPGGGFGAAPAIHNNQGCGYLLQWKQSSQQTAAHRWGDGPYRAGVRTVSP